MWQTLIGIPIGIICSLIAWWILFHGIKPRIRFSEFISKIPHKDGKGFIYRVKYENHGRGRVVDLTYSAFLSIRALSPNRKKTWEIVQLALQNEGQIPALDPVRKQGLRRFILLDLLQTSKMQDAAFPEPIREKYADGTLLLEEVLALGEEAFVQFFVFGYHDWSGSRKLYASKCYRLEDIREGYFEAESLRMILPQPSKHDSSTT